MHKPSYPVWLWVRPHENYVSSGQIKWLTHPTLGNKSVYNIADYCGSHMDLSISNHNKWGI